VNEIAMAHPTPDNDTDASTPAAPAGSVAVHIESMTVDAIMGRIHAEVLGAGGSLPPSTFQAGAAASIKLATWQPSAPRISVKQEYVLDELLAFSDRDFIENAYRAVLRRGPDEGGMNHHLTRLRNGEESKVGILAALRWSPEGEKAGVHVDGLLAPWLLQKWRRKPYIGPLIGWAHSLLRLRSIADRQVVLDAAQAREDQELGRVMNLQAQQIEKLLAEAEAARTRQAMLSTLALDAVSARVDDAVARTGTLGAQLESVHGRLSDQFDGLEQVHGQCTEMAARLAALSEQLGAIEQVGSRVDDLVTKVDALTARLTGLAELRAHSHAVAEQVGTLSSRLDELADARAHSHAVAEQVGTLSIRMQEIADVRAHSNALAAHVGTLSSRLDELAGVRAHSHEVADQVGTLSQRLDQLAAVHAQATELAYRVDTLAARLDGQPDVVPVIRLLSERVEALSEPRDRPVGTSPGARSGVDRGS